MSSAVAMNRKIAAATGGQIPTEYNHHDEHITKPLPQLRGTPIQQLWQISNWHEMRFKKMDDFLYSSSQQKQLTMLGVNQNRRDIDLMKEKNVRLEAELAAIKQHLINNMQSKAGKKKGVTLEVTEE